MPLEAPVTQMMNSPSAEGSEDSPAPLGRSRTGMTAEALRHAIADHLLYSIARPAAVLTPEHYYRALSLAASRVVSRPE